MSSRTLADVRPCRPTSARSWTESQRAGAVDWGTARALKKAGIELAFRHFFDNEWKKKTSRAKQLLAFMHENRDWLDDHALFTVLHDRYRRRLDQLAGRGARPRPRDNRQRAYRTRRGACCA